MKGSAGSTLGIENGICIEIKNRVWEERRPFMAYIEFNNVTKEYKTGETSIKALDGASFSVEKGELAVILGSSGAGKTTALNILGGMDVPTAGEIKVDGRDIAKYNKKQLVGSFCFFLSRFISYSVLYRNVEVIVRDFNLKLVERFLHVFPHIEVNRPVVFSRAPYSELENNRAVSVTAYKYLGSHIL